jgi:hypothetical protein
MIECIHGKAISTYSHHPQEDEILLLSRTTLIAVDDGLQIFGMRVVHLKEIDTKSRSASTNRLTKASNSDSATSMGKSVHADKSQSHKDSSDHTLTLPSEVQNFHGKYC